MVFNWYRNFLWTFIKTFTFEQSLKVNDFWRLWKLLEHFIKTFTFEQSIPFIYFLLIINILILIKKFFIKVNGF